VRERTGRNDGPEIDAWNRALGVPLGSYWCGSYQAGIQRLCGLPVPNGAAGSYNWFKNAGRTYYIRDRRGTLDSLRVGHVVGFYYTNLGRIGHIGRAVALGKPLRAGRPPRGYYVNAGNTGSGGGRDGGGVRVVYYPAYSIYAGANWLYT